VEGRGRGCGESFWFLGKAKDGRGKGGTVKLRVGGALCVPLANLAILANLASWLPRCQWRRPLEPRTLNARLGYKQGRALAIGPLLVGEVNRRGVQVEFCVIVRELCP
jgi:hypothetical protein